MKMLLWDTEDKEPASNWDGTDLEIKNGYVYIKELGCNCDPSSGNMCGGCVERIAEYKIGTRFIWRPE